MSPGPGGSPWQRGSEQQTTLVPMIVRKETSRTLPLDLCLWAVASEFLLFSLAG